MSKEIQRADNGLWKGDTVKISSSMAEDDMESDDDFKVIISREILDLQKTQNGFNDSFYL